MHISVPMLSPDKLTQASKSEPSSTIQSRVQKPGTFNLKGLKA